MNETTVDEIRIWFEEIKEAKKREKDFREDGEKLLDVYDAKKTPFNILYSNTETLLPALLSSVPRPVITRRWKDDDPLGKTTANAAQRMLEYLIDTDMDEYESFPTALENAVLDGLLPGRGNTTIKYDNDNYEIVCPDSREWNKVYFGYAKKWSKVPWIAYEEYLDKDEAREMFGDKALKVKYTEHEEDEEDKGKRKTAVFYQIWDKKTKKVRYICEQSKEDYLRVDDDPLELSGFFNCPKPIQFIKKPSNLIPSSLYSQYENQAKELNRIQLRINKVIEAIKVRGVYDGNFGEELEKVFKEDDNALIPTDKSAALVEGGLAKAIWMLPIQDLVVVLQQLYQARESAKQVIYEITGISDIIRGQSKASETLGAQSIKESWGTMRLKRFQKEVQRYALDMMKIMLEIAATHFSEDTWRSMTMLPFPTTKEKERQVKLYEAQMVQYRQHKAQGIEVSEPQPVNQPSWGEILDVLKNDVRRSYRIDIETNSTLDIEATEDKQNIAEFMNAMAQFMNGVAPLKGQGMSFGAIKSMLLAITKRYRFGREVEDEIQSMQEPQPQIPPEIQKQIEEQQKKLQQAEEALEKEAEKMEQDKQKIMEDIDKKFYEIREKEMELKYEEKFANKSLELERKVTQAELDSDQIEFKAEIEKMLVRHESKIQSVVDKAQAKNQPVPTQKSIKLKRENGELTGADVEYA